MFPKYHFLLGVSFCILLLLFFNISWLGIFLIFVSNFLIDVDHYLLCVSRTKRLNLAEAYKWHFSTFKKCEQLFKRKKIKKKYPHILHTFEFHLLSLTLIPFFPFFLFILIGITFHSLCDFIYLVSAKEIYVREYFLTRYIFSNRKKYV